MITLKQLSCLSALRQTGHFGRAADVIGVTQPALSVQIKELEARLGVKLVERLPGGARLTRTGEEVATRGTEVLAGIREIETLARAHSEGIAGPLRLGIIPSIAPFLLPKLLTQLNRHFPNADFTVRETLTEVLVAELVAGALDVIVASLPLDHPMIEAHVAYDEDFVAVTAADGNGAEPMPMGALAAHKLILLEDGHCLRDQVIQACGKSIGNVDRGGVSNLETLVQLVAHGQGITLIPERFAASGAMDGMQVATRRLGKPVPSRSVALAWRRTHPLADRFKDIVPLLHKCSEAA